MANQVPISSFMDCALRHSANSSAHGDMSKMTSAESVGFDLLALGAFVQLALKWPTWPQRKQIGAGLFPFPAGLSGLPQIGRGGGGFALGLALALGRGGPLGLLPFSSTLGLAFSAFSTLSSKARLRSRVCRDDNGIESACDSCFCQGASGLGVGGQDCCKFIIVLR